MPPSLSRGEPPPCMLIRWQCQTFLTDFPYLTTGQVRRNATWLLSAPNSSFQDGVPEPHLLPPPLSLTSWGFIPCLVIVGEVSQQLPEKAATEDTRARTSARAHAHTLSLLPRRNPIVTSPKAALNFFPPADSANIFLEIHSCRSVKPRRSKHLPNFLILGLLH